VSANLDLVCSIFADWERGDFSSVEWAHPEIEFVIADGPERGTFRGRAGLAEAMRTLFREVEDFRGDAEEYRELDAEQVLTLKGTLLRPRPRPRRPRPRGVGGAANSGLLLAGLPQ
jgi:hypothetical protein